MKTKIIFFLFLTVTVITSHAQQIEYKVRELNSFIQTQKIVSGDWKNELSETEIEGSAYLNEEFTNGTVYTKQNSKYVDVPLRYNAYNDEMEFKNYNDEILAIAAPESIEKIEMGELTFIYIPYRSGNKTLNGYFESVISGNVSLYIRHEIVFIEAQKAGAYKDPKPPKFIKNPTEYYIQIGTEGANLVKSKKNILKILTDHKDEINAFIKKNNTKTNNIDSLAELVKYYNTL